MALNILDEAGSVERPAASWSASRAGLIATATAAALVAMLGLIMTVSAANREGLGPPATIPAWLPLGLLYSAPAVIGWLGARDDRGSLLAAAGLLYLPLAVFAFSGVTVPFLLPALLYLRAAARREPVASKPKGRHSPGRSSRRSLIVLVAGLASAPIVLWIVLNLGIFGVVVVVVVAQVAQAFTQRGQSTAPSRTSERTGGTMRAQLLGALAAAAIVALVLAAGAAAIATAEERCWIRADTPSGPVFRQIPPTNTITLQGNETAGGCDSGTYTPGGIALEAALLLGASGLAVLVTRSGASRPRSP